MSAPKRISVAVAPETVRALRAVMADEEITLTEAIRRLVCYGEFVHTTVRKQRAELLVHTGDSTREVVLF